LTRPNEKKAVVLGPEYDQRLLYVVLDLLACLGAVNKIEWMPFQRLRSTSHAPGFVARPAASGNFGGADGSVLLAASRHPTTRKTKTARVGDPGLKRPLALRPFEMTSGWVSLSGASRFLNSLLHPWRNVLRKRASEVATSLPFLPTH